MLKVDNIILLWRIVIPNMVSKSCRYSKVQSKVTKVSNKGCTLFEGSRERSRASIKGEVVRHESLCSK